MGATLAVVTSQADRVRWLIARTGRSQRDFAAAIGLDPSKMSKSLSGVRRLSSLELARIAELTEVSVDWLVSGQQSPLATAARKSTGSAVDLAVRRARELTGLREDLTVLGYPQSWTPLSSVPAGGMWVAQGDALAQAALARLRDVALDAQAVDLAAVVETAFGADVATVDVGKGVDGLAASTESAWLILLNRSPFPARQRFTLAHELGHLLAGDDLGVHVDEDIFGTKSKSGGIEVRANAFAASLLMPPLLLREAFTAGRFDHTAFCTLAVRLAVSPSALTYRLANLRLVDAMTCERFKGTTSADAARISGQEGRWARLTSASATERRPAQLVSDAFTAYTAGKTTLRPYANLLGTDVDTLREALEAGEAT